MPPRAVRVPGMALARCSPRVRARASRHTRGARRRPEKQRTEHTARDGFQGFRPPGVAVDAHRVKHDREVSAAPTYVVPLNSRTGSLLWRALRTHLDTTCSVLREPVLPQKTHGVEDFVVPATPQCTSRSACRETAAGRVGEPRQCPSRQPCTAARRIASSTVAPPDLNDSAAALTMILRIGESGSRTAEMALQWSRTRRYRPDINSFLSAWPSVSIRKSCGGGWAGQWPCVRDRTEPISAHQVAVSAGRRLAARLNGRPLAGRAVVRHGGRGA